MSSQEPVVTADPGEDVRLPCSTTDTGLERLELTKHTGAHSAQPVVFLSRMPKHSNFPDVENVEWRADGEGNMSAFLTVVERSDEGLYRCQKWKGWEVVLDQNITLKVKGGNDTITSGVFSSSEPYLLPS